MNINTYLHNFFSLFFFIYYDFNYHLLQLYSSEQFVAQTNIFYGFSFVFLSGWSTLSTISDLADLIIRILKKMLFAEFVCSQITIFYVNFSL